MISDGERQYVRDGVAQGVRLDGRPRGAFRQLSVDADLLPLSHGSARVTLGDGTDVMASVKAEVVPLEAGMAAAQRDLLTVHVEASPSYFLATTAAAEAYASDDAAAAHTAAVRSVLQAVFGESGLGDAAQLEIVPGKFAWAVYVDVLLLRHCGNVLDAAAAAAHVALRAARLPATVPVLGEREEIDDFDIMPRPEDAKPLPFVSDEAALPLCVSLARIGEHFVADPTDEEERCADAKLVVAISADGKLRGLHKLGGDAVALGMLPDCVAAARAAATSLFPCLDQVVKSSAEDAGADDAASRPNAGFQFGS
eukprot:CAMPEP_0118879766 /NCGR_PEP_ID=MMETSP1163-20130328/19488_1 /TAXON_ID=124430 /ORGANISM="Phaeomonas parva, Strain CCMP2877" /LENGTH=310 /DNA_ID=CAMNT_0006815999 /DNA_START=8 /DNA_END=940 /DNA_ORIENTATION=-